MYKILIAIDDEYGKKLLRKTISSFNVEIIEASNSADALNYIENGGYLLVFIGASQTELIHKMKELDEDVKVIILSSSENFLLIQEAFRKGAMDYVLYSEMDRYLPGRLSELLVWAQSNEQPEYIVEHYIQMILRGTNVKELEKITDLSYLNEYNRMIMIDFNKDFFGDAGVDFKERISKNKFPNMRYVNLNQQQALFLCCDIEDGIKTAENIIGKIFLTYQEKCYAAVSSKYNGYQEMKDVMEELELLMEDKFYCSPGEVFYGERESNNNEIVSTEDDAIVKRMKQALKIKDIKGLRNNYRKFSAKYKSRVGYSQVYVKFLFANILKDIYEAMPSEDEERFKMEVDSLYKLNDIESVVAIIDNAIDRLEEMVLQNPSTHHKELDIVKKYIYDNYNDEISVDKLAEMVFMSASYLSSIFKRETGENLSYFIKAYRMEKAKEMLDDTVLKIGDISNNCGYPNVSYFCSTFRAHYGVSPQKYRELGSFTVKNVQNTHVI